MATVDAILRINRPLADGSFPIAIRIHAGKYKYIHVGYSAKENQWNKSKGECNSRHNDFIKANIVIHRMRNDIQSRIDDFKARRVEPTMFDLIREKTESVEYDFYKIGENKRNTYLQNEQQGTYLKWGYVMDKMKKYAPTLFVNEITQKFLFEYKEYLSSIGNSQNTIHSNFKVIRAIYNEAIKMGFIGVNPFTEVKIVQTVPIKTRLTMDEINAIADLDLIPGTNIYLAQKMFLFSFFCWGMRFRDVALLEHENIEGKILSYITNKSKKKNPKRITMIMDPRAIDILKCFPKTGKYVFPLVKREYSDLIEFEKVMATADETLNKALKQIQVQAEIKRNISFHTARHSFVDILKKKGVPIEKRMQMVGHTKESVHRMYHGDFDVKDISKISTNALK